MIKEQGFNSLFENELLRFKSEFQKKQGVNSLYQVAQQFTDFTRKILDGEHDYYKVKKCFHLAEEVFKWGNRTVKNAIVNIFIYSLVNKIAEYNYVKDLPDNLLNEYKKQIYAFGI